MGKFVDSWLLSSLDAVTRTRFDTTLDFSRTFTHCINYYEEVDDHVLELL